MKFALLYSLVVALALVQVVVAQEHNFEQGVKGPNDVLVEKKDIYGTTTGYGIPSIQTVYYIHYDNSPNITYISVTDHITDGTGGSARVLYGGVGDREVKIQLRTKKYSFAAMDFTVEIYVGSN